jgi:hypothetical protein
MRLSMLRRWALLWTGVAALAAASPAGAQAPPYPSPLPPSYSSPAPPPYSAPAPYASPEATEITACLCLWHVVTALGTDMTAKQQAYDADRDELERLDEQLQSARAGVDVNDPQSVARFRQLLERRDAAYSRSTSLASGDLNSAIERYNARTTEYNARCANHPRDPALLRRIQATLSCPPPYFQAN